MLPWPAVNESTPLKGHLLSGAILKPHDDRGLPHPGVLRQDGEPGSAASLPQQHLDFRKRAPPSRPGVPPPLGGATITQPDRDLAKMTSSVSSCSTPCGRIAVPDTRTRPPVDPGRYGREHKQHGNPSPTGYTNGLPSLLDVQSSTVPHHPPQLSHHHHHPSSSFGPPPKDGAVRRGPPFSSSAPSDVNVVDGRSAPQALPIDAARGATGQRIGLPASGPPIGVGHEWLRQVPFGETARAGAIGRRPDMTSQPEYTPPLDLSLKQCNTGKRRAPEVAGDDQPLDLSVKRQKKEAEESDDDVILVGVHNPTSNTAGYPSGGGGHVTQLPAGYDKRHIPTAHLGGSQVRPLTSDVFLQPIRNRYSSPRPALPVGSSSGYQYSGSGTKHAIDSPYVTPGLYAAQARQPSPVSIGSRMVNPVSSGTPQQRLTSPIQGHPTGGPGPARGRSSSPRHPSPLPSHRRHASPLPASPLPPGQSPLPPGQSPLPPGQSPLPPSQSIRENRQGVPLVWGLDHQKAKSDAKHPSGYCAAQVKRPSLYSPATTSGKLVLDIGTESRVGPPETYQGPSGQERHIQRIDKHQELSGYIKHSSESTWIPPTVNNSGSVQHPGHGLSANRAARTEVPAPKETAVERPGSNSGKDRAALYLDTAPAPVRFNSHHVTYATATVAPPPGSSPSAAAKFQPEINASSAPCRPMGAPSVCNTSHNTNTSHNNNNNNNNNNNSTGKNGTGSVQQVGGHMTVPYIPKYMVTVQGNKLYQQPKPDKSYQEMMSSAVPSTVREPVRLTQHQSYPMASVPIVKEENAYPAAAAAKSLRGGAYDVQSTIQNDAGSAKTEIQNKEPAQPSQRLDDVMGAQAQASCGTNMVSKTESMFVGAAHKMIPVANVHPIRKLTAEAPSAKSQASGNDDSTTGEGKDSDDGKGDGAKKAEVGSGLVVVPEPHQKIQITPNPVFNSHQEEFVRFLSRSSAGGKNQLKTSPKTVVDGKPRTKRYRDDQDDGEGLVELRGQLEHVPRDLALHFSTPKGRHKLLAKRNSHLVDGLQANVDRADVDKLTSSDKGRALSDATDGVEPTPPSPVGDHDVDHEGKRKKAKGKRKAVAAQQTGAAGESCLPVPQKKRRRKKAERVCHDDEDIDDLLEDRGTFEEEEEDAQLGVKKAGSKRTRKNLTRDGHGPSADVVRRTYRRKNQRVITRHKALRKSRRVALYDKNAAYEAELRKEEERRLLRRVKREERSQVLPQPYHLHQGSEGQGDLKVNSPEEQQQQQQQQQQEPPPQQQQQQQADHQPNDDDHHYDDDTDDVTDYEAPDDDASQAEVRALRSTKQVGAKRTRKLPLRKRVHCRKRKMLRDARFAAEAVVELHPLSMRAKVKAKRLPMEKMMRRRLRKEARPCTNNRQVTDGTDKKRLFVCRETGETTLHKAARKGYVEAALQCLDSDLVDVNVRDNAGYTPLHESCVSGNLVIAKALIARGADANVKALDGTRPLHDAVDNNHIELVRLLLSQGADPTIANYGGRTPLKLARSTHMKTFITDYLADLRDEGPAWELPSFTGKQGAELGFDLFDAVPDSDTCDVGSDVFFDLCADVPLPMFFLRVDKSVGPRNYHLVSDVCRHLGQDNKDDFMLLNSDLHFVEVNKSIVIDQLSANPLCAGDRHLLQQLVDSVQLVEIDSTLCQLLEVSRESLHSIEESGSCVDFCDEIPDMSSGVSASMETDRGKDLETESERDAIGSRTGRLTPPVSRPRDRRRSSNMRKSKSCTSLDVCDWNKTAILRLTALNRSESSPNVQHSSDCVGPPAGCSFQANSSHKKVGKQKKCEANCVTIPAKSKMKHQGYTDRNQLQLDKAVLCNEMAITMTALAREVTKTVLAREVNRKVRLSSKRAAIELSTSWCNSKATKLAEIQKRNLLVGTASGANSGGFGVVAKEAKQQSAQNSHESATCSSDGQRKGETSPLGDCRIATSSLPPSSDTGGVGENRANKMETSSNKPIVDQESAKQGPAKPTAREGTASERCTGDPARSGQVANPVLHDGVPVSSELALPVLENPFEEEAKQVPSVTNEGSGLEEREMPKLTLCTY